LVSIWLFRQKMNFQASTLSSHPEWAYINVKSPDLADRVPVHLSCVIDTSGSMVCESKLENVKKSLHFLLDFLGPKDSISIITFSNVARTVVNRVAVSAIEKENIRARISLIASENNTNLSAGLIEAYNSLDSNTGIGLGMDVKQGTDVKQGILLLTDGIANMGLLNSSEILDIIRVITSKYSGTSISSVGYGTEHAVELLQKISAVGGGSYYVVNKLEDVASVFGDILGGLMSCVAQQVRIIVPAGTEVKTRYPIADIGATSSMSREIIIGDLPAGMESVVLAKIPVGSSVLLKGYDIQHHTSFELRTGVVAGCDNDTNGQAHYIRFEVLDILEKSREFLVSRVSADIIQSQIEKIDKCLAVITEYRVQHEHSLWNILLDELTNCKTMLENRDYVRHDQTQLMTQHSAYLGMMRGIPANLSEEDDETSSPATYLFSNSVQRNISSQLQSSVVPGIVNADADSNCLDPIMNSALSNDSQLNPLSSLTQTIRRR